MFAWIDRFKKAIASAKSSVPKPTTLKGPDAIKHIMQAEFCEPEGHVDKDPLGLQKGQDIEMWPTDSGSKYHDKGVLSALNTQEIVIVAPTKIGGKSVKIHYPRTNFRFVAVSGGSQPKL